jgi:hypothetical protein
VVPFQTLQAIAATVNLPCYAAVSEMQPPAQAQKLFFERVRACKDALIDVVLGIVGIHDTVEEYAEKIDTLDHEAFCIEHMAALAEQAVADVEAELLALAAVQPDSTPEQEPAQVAQAASAATAPSPTHQAVPETAAATPMTVDTP